MAGFASFGPTSLKEFIYNLKELDYNLSKQSFLPLIDLHDLGDVCGSVGFESAVVSSEKVLFKYKKPESALKELRRLSGNPLIDRSKIVSGKNWYKSILFALDKCRDSSGLVTLEFEMIYGHAWKKQKTSENPLTKKNSNEDFFIKEKKIKFFS